MPLFRVQIFFYKNQFYIVRKAESQMFKSSFVVLEKGCFSAVVANGTDF